MHVLFSYHSKIIIINVYNHYYCKLWLLLLSLLSLLLVVIITIIIAIILFFRINKANLRDLIAATGLVISNWIQIVNFSARVTVKFDG